MPSKLVSFRMSAEQKAALEASAKDAGKTVTDYLRSRLPSSIFNPPKRKRRK